KGIQGSGNQHSIQLGSAEFVGALADAAITKDKTALHVKIDGVYYGKYVFENQYRNGLEKLFFDLSKNYEIKVLSGDNDGEKTYLKNILPQSTELIFNQKPEQKLEFIKKLQEEGKN